MGSETFEPAWDDLTLRPKSDSARVAKYRSLQSWYREIHLGVAPDVGPDGSGVGSMLSRKAVEATPDLNFLTPAAYQHAERRIKEVQLEKGSLEPDRLRRNMLSSMPLCFNIFGSLGTHPGFIALLRKLVAPDAVKVTDVVCEWAPSPSSDHLGDRSAFDAFISYVADDGSRRFVGVETKYTEPFSQTAYDKPRYREVTTGSGWFSADAFELLKPAKTNQLWRTTMLAASLEQKGGYHRGDVLVLTTQDDASAVSCTDAVSAQLVDPTRLHHVTFEDLIKHTRSIADPDLSAWADRFELRYLNPDSVA